MSPIGLLMLWRGRILRLSTVRVMPIVIRRPAVPGMLPLRRLVRGISGTAISGLLPIPRTAIVGLLRWSPAVLVVLVLVVVLGSAVGSLVGVRGRRGAVVRAAGCGVGLGLAIASLLSVAGLLVLLVVAITSSWMGRVLAWSCAVRTRRLIGRWRCGAGVGSTLRSGVAVTVILGLVVLHIVNHASPQLLCRGGCDLLNLHPVLLQ